MTLVLQYKADDWFDVADGSMEHKTIVFNAFVWATIFNMFNARKLYREWNIFEGFNRSFFFLIIIVITIGVQIMAVELFRDFMQTRPLQWDHWLGCLICGFVAWPVCLIQKFIPVPEAAMERVFDIEDIEQRCQRICDSVSVELTTRADAEPGLAMQHGVGQATVRVSTNLLDRFVGLSGELLTVRHRLQASLKQGHQEEIEGSCLQLDRLLADLRHQVLDARMVPLEAVTASLPRLVKDLCRSTGKAIRLNLVGNEVRLDRAILEACPNRWCIWCAMPWITALRNTEPLPLPRDAIGTG
jgi:hypothetical protein